MKWFKLSVLFVGIILSFSAKSNKGILLTGKYIWQYTFVEDEMMLVKDKTNSIKLNTYVNFKSNNTFSDNRSATCGNDIFYNKTGKYHLSKSLLILNYTGGKFTDNVGEDSMQTYRRGEVFYIVTKRVPDTIFLRKIKGQSERKVLRPKNN